MPETYGVNELMGNCSFVDATLFNGQVYRLVTGTRGSSDISITPITGVHGVYYYKVGMSRIETIVIFKSDTSCGRDLLQTSHHDCPLFVIYGSKNKSEFSGDQKQTKDECCREVRTYSSKNQYIRELSHQASEFGCSSILASQGLPG